MSTCPVSPPGQERLRGAERPGGTGRRPRGGGTGHRGGSFGLGPSWGRPTSCAFKWFSQATGGWSAVVYTGWRKEVQTAPVSGSFRVLRGCHLGWEHCHLAFPSSRSVQTPSGEGTLSGAVARWFRVDGMGVFVSARFQLQEG